MFNEFAGYSLVSAFVAVCGGGGGVGKKAGAKEPLLLGDRPSSILYIIQPQNHLLHQLCHRHPPPCLQASKSEKAIHCRKFLLSLGCCNLSRLSFFKGFEKNSLRCKNNHTVNTIQNLWRSLRTALK